jgi:hypothetical protein
MGNSVNVVTSIVNSLIANCAVDVSETYLYSIYYLCGVIIVPWFQRFIFIIFIAKGRGKISLWLKAQLIHRAAPISLN